MPFVVWEKKGKKEAEVREKERKKKRKEMSKRKEKRKVKKNKPEKVITQDLVARSQIFTVPFS